MQKTLIKITPIIIIILALFIRLSFLDAIPFSFYHDELDYSVTGQSIRHTGRDLTGQWNPWELKSLQTLNQTAELTASIHAIFFKLFYESILWARVATSVFGIATVLILFFVVKSATGSKHVSLWAAAFLAINPWHIHISRSTFEAPISIFFQTLLLLSIVLIWKNFCINARVKKIIFPLIVFVASFFMGFFTYHGAKITLPAITVGVLPAFLLFKNRLKQKLIIIPLFLIVVLLTGFWTVWQKEQGLVAERDFVFSSEFLSQKVDEKRGVALVFSNRFEIESVVHNKITVFIDEFVRQYLSVFDFYRLFISGYEGGFQFSLIVHGFFMLSSIPLIPMGMWWMHKNIKKQTKLFLLLVFIVAPFASALTISVQSIFRSGLTYVMLASIAGIGAYQLLILIKKIKQRQLSQVLTTLICLVLIFEGLRFGYLYFSQYPIRAVDNYDFKYRLLSEHLQRLSQSEEVIVRDSQPWLAARAHVGYANLSGKLNDKERANFIQVDTKKIVIGNIQFQKECPNFEEEKVFITDLHSTSDCNIRDFVATVSANQVLYTPAISSPLDSGTYYWLINDKLCKDFQLGRFISPKKLSSFRINRMRDQEFCETWVRADYFKL